MTDATTDTPYSDRFVRLLACDYAEHVLPLFEAFSPEDKRLGECVRIARLFANGEATEEQFREACSDAEKCVSTVIEAIQSSNNPFLVAYPYPFLAAAASSELYALESNVSDCLLTVANLGRNACACAARMVKAHELPPIGITEDRAPHVKILSEAEELAYRLEEQWQTDHLTKLLREANETPKELA